MVQDREKSIKVNILFFGSTADIVGKRHMEVDLPPDWITSQIFEHLVAGIPELSKHRLHYSVNQNYATGFEALTDGDEIAIFTAVSGG